MTQRVGKLNALNQNIARMLALLKSRRRTRPEIARLTGMEFVTVTNYLKAFEAEGLIKRIEDRTPPKGATGSAAAQWEWVR